jgi:hypothetical protein
MKLPWDRLRPDNMPLPVDGRTPDPERAIGHYNNARQIVKLQLANLAAQVDRGWEFESEAPALVCALLGVLRRCQLGEIAFLVDTSPTRLRLALTTGALETIRHATNEANYCVKLMQARRVQHQTPSMGWVRSILENLERRVAAAASCAEW